MPSFPGRFRASSSLLLLCIVTIALTTKGLGDEAAVSFNGDMPKYMMNGVFFYDFLTDLPQSLFHPLDYAYRYFAKYPALSLGHHPLLISIAQLPFYLLFGISVQSSKLIMTASALASVAIWFLLILRLFNLRIAFFSSLLFITTPFIVENSRVVMSEIPTLALMITSSYFFYCYTVHKNTGYMIAFLLTLVVSVYSKQTTVFTIPFFFLILCFNGEIKNIYSRLKLPVIAAAVIVLAPIIFITLKFSAYNVALTQYSMQQSFFSNLIHVVAPIYTVQLSAPVLALSLATAALSVYRRRRKEMAFVLWILIFCTFSAITRLPIPRHTLYWIPPFCLLAAATIDLFSHRCWKLFIAALLALVGGIQFTTSFSMPPERAEGYEEAAKLVTESNEGNAVLYSSKIDTGYFVFFVRKHDERRRMLILRADKILATSMMDRIVADRIHSREEIYAILKDFGIRQIVVEDVKFESPALNILHQELQTDKFLLKKEIPIVSNNRMLNGVKLLVYEYKDWTEAGPDATISMDIPLIGERITTPLKDLTTHAK